MMAAVTAAFFAAQDDPAPSMVSSWWGHGRLVVAACPCSACSRRCQTSACGAGAGGGVPAVGLMLHPPRARCSHCADGEPGALLSLQNLQRNIQPFLNSSIAMFIGIGFAVVMTRRSVRWAAEWTARRLCGRAGPRWPKAEGRGSRTPALRCGACSICWACSRRAWRQRRRAATSPRWDMLNEARIGLKNPADAPRAAGTARAQPRSGRGTFLRRSPRTTAADCRTQADGGGRRIARAAGYLAGAGRQRSRPARHATRADGPDRPALRAVPEAKALAPAWP